MNSLRGPLTSFPPRTVIFLVQCKLQPVHVRVVIRIANNQRQREKYYELIRNQIVRCKKGCSVQHGLFSMFLQIEDLGVNSDKIHHFTGQFQLITDSFVVRVL